MNARHELRDLASRIQALTSPEKLRVAAELFDRGRADVAHMLVEQVATELGAALALRRLDTTQKGGRA